MYNGEYHNPLGNPYQLTSVKGPFQVFEHFWIGRERDDKLIYAHLNFRQKPVGKTSKKLGCHLAFYHNNAIRKHTSCPMYTFWWPIDFMN